MYEEHGKAMLFDPDATAAVSQFKIYREPQHVPRKTFTAFIRKHFPCVCKTRRSGNTKFINLRTFYRAESFTSKRLWCWWWRCQLWRRKLLFRSSLRGTQRSGKMSSSSSPPTNKNQGNEPNNNGLHQFGSFRKFASSHPRCAYYDCILPMMMLVLVRKVLSISAWEALFPSFAIELPQDVGGRAIELAVFQSFRNFK